MNSGELYLDRENDDETHDKGSLMVYGHMSLQLKTLFNLILVPAYADDIARLIRSKEEKRRIVRYLEE